MPLPSFSSGLIRLPCVLKYSRPTRLHHVLKFQLHTSSTRQLPDLQSDTSSISNDLNFIDLRKNHSTNNRNLPSTPLHQPPLPNLLRSSRRRSEATRLRNNYKALHAKFAQLRKANDKDFSFSEVVEEVAGESSVKNILDLSRLSTLYGEDEAQAALSKIHALLETFSPKATAANDQQKEHLQYMKLVDSSQKVGQDNSRLIAYQTRIYKQLLTKLKENGGLAHSHLSLKERRKQALVASKQTETSIRRITSNDTPNPQQSPKTRRSSTPSSLLNVPDFTDGSLNNLSLPEKQSEVRKPEIQHQLPPTDAQVTDTSFIAQIPVNTEDALDVPSLSFDLSRVLFNPGVYQLQDPRSRVYNFDPYIQNITPVNQFNWAALNQYITSSEDHFLRDEAIKQKKRYIGSSSSMSGAMSQFHFLLSAWRPLDFSNLSKKMEGWTSFTQITRAPASIFLRYRNGVYAVDSDKEHDTPNILMMHGRSMEKLLTLEKEEFEKYKMPKEGEEPPMVDVKPESYHYSTVENFLLRSQLDAHDPRLPGTGMFDLKTRAVAGIRMYLGNHESGMNYEIKSRFGLWESYEREYYDMIRAAFLKYSLQVRMGRMDGIFVAYHNISRIFGFQYIPISELDQALHGQADSTVGDREFKMTLKLMNELFDRATKACPGQSLRLMFETREPPKDSENAPIFMRIFAEVVTEEEIEAIQAAGKEKVEDYEDNMVRGIDPREEAKAAKLQLLQEKVSTKATPSTLDSTLADSAFLDSILGKSIDSALKAEREPEPEVTKPEPPKTPREESERTVLCWKLRIYNEVNGYIVDRPEKITSGDRWNVHYTIEQETEGIQALSNSVKNRRRTMFAFDEDEDASQNWFLRNIMKMNESGKRWRAEQNELDAKKEKVTLYPSSSTSANT